MVRLVVTDEDGLTAKTGHDILVEPQASANQPPTAAIQAADRTRAGQGVQFDAGGSSDPDGQIVSYNWNFDDGTTAAGVQVTHTFGQPGKYLVRLTVADNGGLTAQATHGVLVEPKAPANQPIPGISGPTQGPVGQALTFSASGSHDPDGQIVSYVWDLGDGTTGNGVVVTHTYSAPGTYLVRLTVTDDSGLSAAAQHPLRVEQGPQANQPPTAVINVPTRVSVNQLVQFDGSGSSDPDGQIVHYAWSFGGGASGSGVTTTHVYSQAGTYQVTLTVTDNGGYTAAAGQIIQVQPGPQSGVFQPSIIQGNRSRDPGSGTRTRR
jgi:PKD repeat protein